jgi:hypothetical protein
MVCGQLTKDILFVSNSSTIRATSLLTFVLLANELYRGIVAAITLLVKANFKTHTY